MRSEIDPAISTVLLYNFIFKETDSDMICIWVTDYETLKDRPLTELEKEFCDIINITGTSNI